jgi:DNA invertase Pin-like site-specific DNA recombinase
MKVGYARVSAPDQSLEAQLGRLSGCDKVFFEKHTGRKIARPEWDRCMEFVREGDTLVVTRLDRMARSVSGLCAIIQELGRKGVHLVVLDQDIDTASALGRLLFHVIAAIGEFELDIRREAQRAGIAIARSKGLYKGRAPTLAQDDIAALCGEFERGMRASALARRFRVSKRTVYRYIERKDRYLPPASA